MATTIFIFDSYLLLFLQTRIATPTTESLLFAEVQPVFDIFICKVNEFAAYFVYLHHRFTKLL
jgi:hypothetical protein